MKKVKQVLKAFAILVSILLAYVTGEYYAIFEPLKSATMPAPQFVLIGHRGAAGLAPENTLAGIDTALKLQVPFIEIDVHLSLDKALVVMHDSTVDRTTNGEGKIRKLNWRDIAQLDAGSHFSPAFAAERVPTLEQVLAKIKPTETQLLIEVKNPKRYPGIAEGIAEALRETGTQNQAVVISFDKGFIQSFKRTNPEVKVGCLYVFPPSPSAPELAIADVVGMHWISDSFCRNRIQKIRSKGIKTWAWTVNSQRQLHKLRASGFDGVITDYPDLQTIFSAPH